MLSHMLPLLVTLLVQGDAADPVLRGLPALAWTAPERAPDLAGKASTYGRAGDGRRGSRLACAPRARAGGTTHVCAHRTLRCGTLLLVENTATGQATLCRVMDRGPYGKLDEAGRWFNGAREPDRAGVFRGELDLAPATRARLGPGDGGLLRVRAWIVERPPARRGSRSSSRRSRPTT